MPQWEYKECYFEMKKANGTYVWFDARASVAKDLLDVWVGEWESKIRGYLKEELAQGWEIDPTAWGPSCIVYESKGLGPSGWHLGYWIGYICLSLITLCIGFFILPFVMKRSVIELHGVNVKLRTLKQA
jgi:hypothetical protein